MENGWQLFLRQLSSADPIFTYDDVCDWTDEEYDALATAGLIQETGPAVRVRCDACDLAHYERVHWSDDGATAFISCRGGSPVDIDPARLRLWRADLERFADLLAASFPLTGDIRPLPAKGLWFLGRRRVAGNNPYFFFGAISPADVPSAAAAIREAYGPINGVLLAPFAPGECAQDGKLKIINLGLAVSLRGQEIHADLDFLEDQLTDGASMRSSPEKKPTNELRARRREILNTVIKNKGLDGMDGLARHLGVSGTALQGMVRGDKSRYGEDTLLAVLKKLDCPLATWNEVPRSTRPT